MNNLSLNQDLSTFPSRVPRRWRIKDNASNMEATYIGACMTAQDFSGAFTHASEVDLGLSSKLTVCITVYLELPVQPPHLPERENSSQARFHSRLDNKAGQQNS